MSDLNQVTQTKKYEITILWGKCPEPDDKPIHYAFHTLRELEAFIYGIEECDGWLAYKIIDPNDSDNREEMEAK